MLNEPDDSEEPDGNDMMLPLPPGGKVKTCPDASGSSSGKAVFAILAHIALYMQI